MDPLAISRPAGSQGPEICRLTGQRQYVYNYRMAYVRYLKRPSGKVYAWIAETYREGAKVRARYLAYLGGTGDDGFEKRLKNAVKKYAIKKHRRAKR